MELNVIGLAGALLFGAAVGSFLNVLIYRLPRGESLAFPPSHCPACGARIRARDNVPVLGWLVLRGRCRDCAAPISPRYPLVEALTAALCAALWLQHGPSALFAVRFVFLAGLVAVTFIDLDHRIIPDSLSLGGVVVGLACSLWLEPGWRESALGAVLGGGLLLAVALGWEFLTGREGMGFGDVKLLAAIGAFLGWKAVLFTVLASSLTGSVVGLVLAARRRQGLRLEVPFGPFLALGAALWAFTGPATVDWYLGLFP